MSGTIDKIYAFDIIKSAAEKSYNSAKLTIKNPERKEGKMFIFCISVFWSDFDIFFFRGNGSLVQVTESHIFFVKGESISGLGLESATYGNQIHDLVALFRHNFAEDPNNPELDYFRLGEIVLYANKETRGKGEACLLITKALTPELATERR